MSKAIRGGSFYTLVSGPSWTQAQANAASLGGNLVTINDADEDKFVWNSLRTSGWIGLTDKDSEGRWRSPIGEEIRYSNWAPGEPNNAGNTQHYAWYWDSYPGRWDDHVNNASNVSLGIAEIPVSVWFSRSAAPKEGAGPFTTTINLSAASAGRRVDGITVYWSVSGITADDLASGSLTGFGTISEGKLNITHSLLSDSDLGEDFRVSVFSDPSMLMHITNVYSIPVEEGSKNDGQASFRIDGSATTGQTLNINRSSDDPDGNGSPTYTWQSFSNSSWITIGSGQSYQIAKNDQGKDIRALINYTDGEGFQESITTSSIKISKTNSGSASFKIDGFATSGQTLTANRTSDDPDGNGSASYLWQSSTNGSEWNTIGSNQTYQVTNSEQGKQIRVQVFYEDASGFRESVTTEPVRVPFSNNGSASFAIAGSPAAGQVLSVTRINDDPDGNGSPTYTWKLQGKQGSGFETVSNGSIYKVSRSDQGRTLQVEINYTDGKGFSENPTPLSILIPSSPVEQATFKIAPSKTAINEGETVTTTIISENAKPGTSLYWSLTGEGVDKNDFSRGSLTGQGVLDGNGTLTISHTFKEDQSSGEDDETINIAIFSDPTRTKLLTAPVQVLVNDTSAKDSQEDKFRTFDSEVQEYKIGTTKPDRLVVSDSEKSKSWALWGEGGADKLTGGTKDDYLIGGDGIDDLTGGKGSDTFVMSDFIEKNYDIIKDFVAKDDVIGISRNLIDASEDDTVALVKYQDIRTKVAAEKFFKTKGVDHYILVDTSENIKKVNSRGYSEKILLAVDLTAKSIRYDSDGVWNKGSDVLCRFTGKMSFNSWSADNFAFGIDLV